MHDSLAEWLWYRYWQEDFICSWNDLSESTHSFWEREAESVRRAVWRSGFKNYDPAKSKDKNA